MKQIQSLALALTLILSLGFGNRDVSAMPIDFESFTDGDVLTNQITGLTFSGGAVWTAGNSLNEIDFPPHSGNNVLATELGILTISATNPFDQFSAYFTYSDELTFKGFDITNTLLFSFTSLTSSNLGFNTLIGFANPGISSLVITANGNAGFTMDDLDVSNVPEPGTLALLSLGLVAASLRRQKRASDF